MAATFPLVLESWPAGRAVWVAGWDGLRHYVPAGGGGAGVCLRVILPAPPVMAFPDLDESCCPACLRLAVAAELPAVLEAP